MDNNKKVKDFVNAGMVEGEDLNIRLFNLTSTIMKRYKVGKVTARKLISAALASSCVHEEFMGQVDWIVNGFNENSDF